MEPLRIAAKRLLGAIPSLVGVVVVTFLLSPALPGDPAFLFAGPAPNADSVARVRAHLGLGRTLPVQFLGYAGDMLHGNLGQRVQGISRRILPAGSLIKPEQFSAVGPHTFKITFGLPPKGYAELAAAGTLRVARTSVQNDLLFIDMNVQGYVHWFHTHLDYRTMSKA